MKPQYDEPLSNCASNFNLRRYIKGDGGKAAGKKARGVKGEVLVADVNNPPPIVKLPSSEERLNELKHALEEGMGVIEEGQTVITAAVGQCKSNL